MILNLVLLLLVFGTSRKRKLKPYLAGLIIGGIKAGTYLFFSSGIVTALFMGWVFGLLGAALVYLIDHITKKPSTLADPAKMYSSMEKSGFYWEYIPITGIVLVMVGGEWVLSLVTIVTK